MNNKYEKLVTDFFDKLEPEIEPLKLKKKRALIASTSALGTSALLMLLSRISAETEKYFIIAGVLAIIVCIGTFYAARNYSLDTTLRLYEGEKEFYDEVFINMVAGELNGNATCVSEEERFFDKQRAYEGLVLSSKEVELTGTVEGKPFTYIQSREDVITSVITDRDNDKVIYYRHSDTPSIIHIDFNTRRNAEMNIRLMPMGKREKHSKHDNVRLDNKHFRFHVDCGSELSAYKFFTADVMEGIQEWHDKSNIISLEFEGTTGNANYNNHTDGLDLYYRPSFSKNMQKNREKYNADKVLNEAMKSVVNIQTLMKEIPRCIA